MNEHISFSQKLVDWYNLHGRHNLPWQAKQTAYHVWISEIMLQQTQVATVIPYFKNFIQKLPTINALAAAQEDDVMRLWTGLGYYSRARNLMKTARIIQTIYHGEFPRKIDRLIALPGIGRSTAGAIISLAFEAKAPILDGNVKRILARYHGILGWPGNGKVARKFWAVAEASLPDKDHRAYAQSLMDLGATLCTRSKPDCTRCPLKEKCHAKKNNKISELPGKKPPQIIKRQSFFFIIIMNQLGNILLQKQPPKGVWGGLWCFPKAEDEKECSIVLDRLNIGKWQQLETMSSFQHRLTHVAFQITPLLFSSSVSSKDAATVDNVAWYNIRETELVGLPAPVKKLMLKLARAQEKLLQ